ncbi:MAG: 30S ribosomal protein S2, partial [Thermodesulfobacteriota bacterium]
LNEIEEMKESGQMDTMIKKEALQLDRKRVKLEKFLGGVKTMDSHPDAVFIIDSKKEDIALKEAKKLGIPIVAIVDTNCDPDDVDYIIPGNDDAIRAVKLFAAAMADACIEGRAMYEESLQAASDKGKEAAVTEETEGATEADADVEAGAEEGIGDAGVVKEPEEVPAVEAETEEEEEVKEVKNEGEEVEEEKVESAEKELEKEAGAAEAESTQEG